MRERKAKQLIAGLLHSCCWRTAGIDWHWCRSFFLTLDDSPLCVNVGIAHVSWTPSAACWCRHCCGRTVSFCFFPVCVCSFSGFAGCPAVPEIAA